MLCQLSYGGQVALGHRVIRLPHGPDVSVRVWRPRRGVDIVAQGERRQDGSVSSMTGKLTLALGFAAGYVLGSKAGRERYEQIVGASRRLWSNQTVQSTAGVLQAQASDLVHKAKEGGLAPQAKHTGRLR